MRNDGERGGLSETVCHRPSERKRLHRNALRRPKPTYAKPPIYVHILVILTEGGGLSPLFGICNERTYVDEAYVLFLCALQT